MYSIYFDRPQPREREREFFFYWLLMFWPFLLDPWKARQLLSTFVYRLFYQRPRERERNRVFLLYFSFFPDIQRSVIGTTSSSDYSALTPSLPLNFSLRSSNSWVIFQSFQRQTTPSLNRKPFYCITFPSPSSHHPCSFFCLKFHLIIFPRVPSLSLCRLVNFCREEKILSLSLFPFSLWT